MVFEVTYIRTVIIITITINRSTRKSVIKMPSAYQPVNMKNLKAVSVINL